jgi:RNA polymerase sigma factor (sigma-70 family)
MLDAATQRLLRELAPRVLGAVARRYGDFAAAEDVVQEALLAAVDRWPEGGLPANPVAWLIHVAGRRIADHVRAEAARRQREALVVSLVSPDEQVALALAAGEGEVDDTLELLFMCCHPALSPASAIALTLRAVGGLTTAEIARAFLVPEPTLAQRISRAKQTIAASGVPFESGAARDPGERAARLAQVNHVLYLMFNEGYTASSGAELSRADLASEAIRLTRTLHRLVPDQAEVTGLLALMLLTDARRAARAGPAGELIPLDEQDRSLWDRPAIEEGVALVSAALPRGQVGPYQLQAAIAAAHDEAATWESTDWDDILGLYGLLLRMSDNPMVRLNRAVALAMVHGPRAGLAALDELAGDPRLSGHHRLDAVRGHLLERAGDRDAAVAAYRRAAQRTSSTPERDYLLLRAARL